MKKFRVLFFTALILLSALLLSGCGSGSTVTTKLEIGADLSGRRIMQLAVDEDSFNNYFSGTAEDLKKLIAENCPPELAFAYDESTFTYSFLLEFDSFEDYKAKVEAITGQERNIAWEFPDSLWASGARIEEDFSSKDLLKWMSDAILSAGYVDSLNEENIFGNGSTTVEAPGITEDTSASIYVNTVKYLPLRSIDIYVTAKGADEFTEQVVFDVPKMSMDAKGEEIDAFMDAAKPAGGTMKRNTTEEGRVYTLTTDKTALKDLAAALEPVFGKGNVTVTEKPAESVFTWTTPFDQTVAFDQSIDVSDFCYGEEGVLVRYLLKEPQGFTAVGGPADADGFHTLNQAYEYAGTGPFVTSVAMRKIWTAAKLETETEVLSADRLRLKADVILAEDPDEGLLELFKKQTEARVPAAEETSETPAEGAEEKAAVTVNTGKDGRGAFLSVGIEGAPGEVRDAAQAVFNGGFGTDTAFEEGAMKVKKAVFVRDRADYSAFIVERTNDFTFTYTLKVDGVQKSVSAKTDGGTPEFELTKNGLTAVNNEPFTGVISWYGEKTDVLSLASLGGLGLGGVLVLLGLILGIVKAVKNAPKKEKPVKIAADPEPAENTRFCVNCGAALKPGVKFCEKCGTKAPDMETAE